MKPIILLIILQNKEKQNRQYAHIAYVYILCHIYLLKIKDKSNTHYKFSK